jgi:lauroyl/myristoyl acyltransferase
MKTVWTDIRQTRARDGSARPEHAGHRGAMPVTPTRGGSNSRAPMVPLLAARDVVTILNLAAATAAVRTLPERQWEVPGRLLAAVRLQLDPRWAARQRRRMTAALGADAPIDQIIISYSGHQRAAKFQVLRLRRMAGWQPKLRLNGREHLEAALAQGQGAILWGAPFVYASLLAKVTLHEAGFPVAHLSHYSHGFSHTRLGVQLLNPIVTTVEDRFLAERVMIDTSGNSLGPLRTLTNRLRCNRPVSITFGSSGIRPVRARLLEATVDVATGAPGLAEQTGARLLPMATLREADGTFTTTIGPPLTASKEGRQGSAPLLIAEMIRWLEPRVREAPGQWWWDSDVTEQVPISTSAIQAG